MGLEQGCERRASALRDWLQQRKSSRLPIRCSGLGVQRHDFFSDAGADDKAHAGPDPGSDACSDRSTDCRSSNLDTNSD
jgi:hypothetical protein